jgi:5-methylcytosine-specific restriction endonuclease McrA
MARAYPDPLSASVEHVIPRSLGGGDDLANLRLSHLHCNTSRGARPVRSVRPPVRSALVAGIF